MTIMMTTCTSGGSRTSETANVFEYGPHFIYTSAMIKPSRIEDNVQMDADRMVRPSAVLIILVNMRSPPSIAGFLNKFFHI